MTLQRWFSPAARLNEEEAQLAQTLRIILCGLLVAAGLAALILLVSGELRQVGALGIGAALLVLAFWLTQRGHTRPASFLMLTDMAALATYLLYLADGLQDIAILIFPATILAASLLLQMRMFVALVGLIMLALGLIAHGQVIGWINNLKPKPLDVYSDFIFALIILSLTALAAHLLAENMRRNLHRARRNEQALKVTVGQLQHEVTERLRAEAEIQRLNATLERRVTQRTAQLEHTVQELAEAYRELEEVSYSISHDLRAPVRAVDGFAHLLKQHGAALDPQALHYIQRIQASNQRMGRLVDDLLAWSRLGRQAAQARHVSEADLRQMIERAIEELRAAAPARQIEIRLDDLPACWADSAMLRQVWANLLDNAFKYTHTRSVARIEVGWRGGAYFVRDNGIGFDMTYAGKLFGMFQRLHHSDEFEGTGIGLAVVQRIVHKHGGKAWAEAAVDKGAAFYFTLDVSHSGGDSRS